MSGSTGMARMVVRAVLVLTMVLLSARVWAECTAEYVGLASINEISDKEQFIEVKILSSSIDASVYSQWSLDFCATDGKNKPTVECAFDLPLSGAGIDISGLPWLVRTGLGGAAVDLAGMDVRLKDAAGRTIDYVKVGPGAGDARIPDPDCNADDLPYDSYLPPVSGQAGQFAKRLPDGTGDWFMATGASDGKSTDSTTNDEDATGPAINVYGDGVFAGDTAVFTVSLPDGVLASEDIQIQYQTEDQSAVAPGDYQAQSGTVTLVTGANSVDIEVATNADADHATERFYLRITGVSYGIPESTIAIGEIWPAATGLWQFEQTTEDSSGNGLDGDVNGWFSYSDNMPAIQGAVGTCHYGVLSNETLEYGRFSVSDNSLLDLSESLTIAAWVRRDESGSGYILSKGSNYQWFADADGRLYWLWQGHSLVSGTGVLPRGAWAHIAVTYKSGEQILYVNGEAVDSDTVSGGLPTNSSPLILGRDAFFNLIGTGSRFDGAVDELHIYSSALPSAAIRAVFELTYPCGGVAVLDRLEVTAPTSASVCAPLNVRLTAYDTSGNVFEQYDGSVALQTSSNHGRWSPGGSRGTLSPAPDTSDDGQAVYQFVTADNGDVTLTFSNTHADQLTFTAIDQATGISVTSDPVTFAENALYIEKWNDDFGYDLIAGRKHPYKVSMLKQDPDPDPASENCGVAADYDGTYSLKAWLVREEDDPVGAEPLLASSSDSVLLKDSEASAGNLEVIFASGTAKISLTASDVGHYTLNLRDESSGFVQAADGTPLSIVSVSASAPWTARPFAIAMEIPGNPGAQDATGPSFQAAGEVFTLRVGGALYDSADDTNGDGVADAGANLMDNGFAASFGQEGESVVLAADLLAPATGTNPGLGGPTLEASDYSGGVAAPTDFFFSEVGIIDVSGDIGDGNYLGAGSARTARMEGTTGPVGRFIPHHLTVSVDDDGVIEAVCGAAGGFTYSGQDSGWSLEPTVEVIPKNQAGAQTRNYLVGGFMRLLPDGVSRTWPTQDESALLSDGVTPYPVTVVDSIGEILPRSDGDPILYRYAGDDIIRYSKSPDALIAPFIPSLTFEIDGVVDEDGATALETGPNSSVPLVLPPASDGEVVYGRRVMENVYGPETAEELLMPVSMEYWTGTGFAVNDSDNCTDWNVDSSLEDNEQYHTLASRGDTGTFSNGLADPLVLEPSGTPGEERLTWLVPVWQQHDWNGDNALQDPSALATFGVYRGHDRIIYWREVEN
ncbi:DUF6701 domain-containing protein [Marinobacter lacisalsi]|uniref:DUF6701 domain-containing protein n=1 Tax=Marinobacter lacisalsi TaxID=475979 RepID=A0ABV8QFQ6_9GAMM